MSFFWVIILAVVVVITFAVGQGTNSNALVATIVFFPALIALYFAPMGIAVARQHPRAGAITVLNLLAGWTLIGWVAAMVWAYASGAEPGSLATANTETTTKQCPFCAESIQAEAIKCRYCGSDLLSAA